MSSSKSAGNEGKIIRIPSLNYTPNPKGVGHEFLTQMLKNKDKIAQIEGLTGKTETFGSLRQRCIRAAITLRSKGIKPGDMITLCSYNHIDSCVPFIASLLVGATISSVDPTLSLNDNTDLLKQIIPKIIFVVPESLEMIEEAVKKTSPDIKIVVFGETVKHTPFLDFVKPSDEEANFKLTEPKSLQDTCAIFFSSGTSGLPKGICINHSTFLGQIMNLISFGYCMDLIFIHASLYWATSAALFGAGIVNGSPRLMFPRFEVEITWKRIEHYKPSLVFLGPSHGLLLLKHANPEGIDLSSVKDIVLGGGAMLKESMLKIRATLPGIRVTLSYGLTEVIGFVTCFMPSNPKNTDFVNSKPISSGTGIPGFSYKVIDPDTEEILGPNQKGELRIKSDLQLTGYHNMDSSGVWDSEGWIITGDEVYYDEDHCFYIVDRIKELLKFHNWQVSPAMLENLLLTHPAIAAAVVVGTPHEIDIDHPTAIVVLKDSAKNADPLEIEKYVEERVHDRQRLRGGVKIVNSIPMTPSGKVKRKEVKNMLLQKKL